MTKRQVRALGPHLALEIFPTMAADQLKELATDIMDNGLHKPIAVDSEGRILDGRSRLVACMTAGVEPRYVEIDRSLLKDPYVYVCRENLHTHPVEHRALAAGVLFQRVGSRGYGRPGIEKMLGITSSGLQRGIKVVSKCDASVIDLVEAGRMLLGTAERVADLTGDQQRQIATLVNSGMRPVVALKRITGPLATSGTASASGRASIRNGTPRLDQVLSRVEGMTLTLNMLSDKDFMDISADDKKNYLRALTEFKRATRQFAQRLESTPTERS